ncbi:MAG: hypothetical protein EOO73_12880 [Myxococcales bacterium]|nr:MAG: hypothetical protein EOO73_12880 [Myxococcales bacterium]
MNGPVRLLESSRNTAARNLLHAGAAERPHAKAVRGAALALGLSATAIAGSTATAAAATTTVATAGAATVALKSLAVGTLIGLTLAGSATLASHLAAPAERASNPAAVRPAVEAESQPAKRLPAPPIRPATSASATAATGTPQRAPQRVVAAAAPVPSAASSARLPDGQSLSREIALIDGARRALTAGDAAAALRELDDHDRRARTGTLDREAQLLRIDALASAGRNDAARALAERYLVSYPNDPHAARLRALLAAP